MILKATLSGQGSTRDAVIELDFVTKGWSIRNATDQWAGVFFSERGRLEQPSRALIRLQDGPRNSVARAAVILREAPTSECDSTHASGDGWLYDPANSALRDSQLSWTVLQRRSSRPSSGRKFRKRNLHGSVGYFGANHSDDVRLVTELLNGVPKEHGGPVETLDSSLAGECSVELMNAITAFQKAHFGWGKARLEAESATLYKLYYFSDASAGPRVPIEAIPGGQRERSIVEARRGGPMLGATPLKTSTNFSALTPGDICFTPAEARHSLVTAMTGTSLSTIDADAEGQEIETSEHQIRELAGFYSFDTAVEQTVAYETAA